jgi:hypothetical protein
MSISSAALSRAALVARRAEGKAEKARQEARIAVQMAPDHDVLERRHVEEDLQVLEGARDAASRALGGRALRHVLACEHDPAGGRRVDAVDQVEQRRLARAIRADDRVDLALRDREVELRHGGDAAEALGQALDREEGRAQGHLRPADFMAAASVGTRPRGMKIITRIRIAPSTMCL